MQNTKTLKTTSVLDLNLSDARFAPVSSADAVYDLLKKAILDGRLPQGERLREVELSKSLGVSRTPLREAFTRLLSDRLLERTSSGVVIVDAEARLLGVRQIRVALEGYATRLAVPNLNDEDMAVLSDSIRLSVALPFEAVSERIRNNNVFHRRIYAACGVPQLHDAIEEYAAFFMNEAELRTLSQEEAALAIEDHKMIFAAIQDRDADKAEKIMRQHVTLNFPPHRQD